jgi:hypothetical protein
LLFCRVFNFLHSANKLFANIGSRLRNIRCVCFIGI